MTKIFIAVAAAAALAVAGCGGGDSSEESNQALSYGAYGEAASKVCEDSQAATDNIGGELTGQPEQDLETLEQLEPELDKAINNIEALDPPAELEATHEEYVALLQQQYDGFIDAKEAAEAGDAAEYQRVLEAVNEGRVEAERVASKLGAEDCL